MLSVEDELVKRVRAAKDRKIKSEDREVVFKKKKMTGSCKVRRVKLKERMK